MLFINNFEEQIKSNNRLIETLKEENNKFNINSKELIDKTKNFELVKTELVTINNKIIDLPSKLKEIQHFSIEPQPVYELSMGEHKIFESTIR